MFTECRHARYFAALPQLILALIVIGVSHLGCRSKAELPLPSASITIAYPTNVSAALALIALDKSFFARYGVKIDSKAFETGKAALAQMLDGQADIAVVAETPIAQTILNDGDLRILASIEQSGLDVCIVARKDHGVHSPKDLKGKMIGYTQGTSGHYFLDSFLVVNRLQADDVILVSMSPLQLREALLKGRVDAVVTWDPHIEFLTRTLGDQVVRFRDEFIYTQVFCVVARPDFIQKHPEHVKAILKGLVAAQNLLFRSRDEAIASIAKLSKVDSTMVANVLSNHDLDVRLDQGLLISLEDEAQWLMDSGAVSPRKLPNFLDYMHLSGLQEVRPIGVQVIRSGESEER